MALYNTHGMFNLFWNLYNITQKLAKIRMWWCGGSFACYNESFNWFTYLDIIHNICCICGYNSFNRLIVILKTQILLLQSPLCVCSLRVSLSLPLSRSFGVCVCFFQFYLHLFVQLSSFYSLTTTFWCNHIARGLHVDRDSFYNAFYMKIIRFRVLLSVG